MVRLRRVGAALLSGVTEMGGAGMGREVDRRRFLKGGMALALAAPAVLSARPTPARAQLPRPSVAALAGLTSQQAAGQRVIFSYPGLNVPSSLLDQISA